MLIEVYWYVDNEVILIIILLNWDFNLCINFDNWEFFSGSWFNIDLIKWMIELIILILSNFLY